jgi:nodulation protein E
LAAFRADRRVSRVLVTGLGVVANAGDALDAFWAHLLRGENLFSPLAAAPDAGLIVGALPDETWADDLPLKSTVACDRTAMLAVAAAKRALADAGLSKPFAAPERVAVVVGCGAGGATSLEEGYTRLLVEDKRPSPFTVVRTMPSATASWVSVAFGAQGPGFVTASACASSSHAIAAAAALIRGGLADVALAGGAEACLTRGAMFAWESMKLLSRTALRPYAAGRDGLVIGEGAGMIVLESEAHARTRGNGSDIALLGAGAGADAVDMVKPHADGMIRAMRAALNDAGLAPQDIGYINGHGVGTRANDQIEMLAVAELFGANGPPLSSIKAVTGHTLGASGALNAVTSVLALRHRTAPPNGSFDAPEPDCAADLIVGEPRAIERDAVISNAFAFGGFNASLVFAKV